MFEAAEVRGAWHTAVGNLYGVLHLSLPQIRHNTELCTCSPRDMDKHLLSKTQCPAGCVPPPERQPALRGFRGQGEAQQHLQQSGDLGWPGFLGWAVRGTAFVPVTEGNVFNGFNDLNQDMIRNKFVHFSILFQLDGLSFLF